MAINLGSTAIADAKLGSTQVDKIYLGSTEIWSKSAPSPNTWTGIQQIVRSGNASSYFTVGDEISVACPWTDPSSNTEYNWVWVVADIGTTYKESDPSTAVPAMTLIAKYLTPSAYMFDNTENVVADEATAQADVYYYGWNGSSMTPLNLTTGATIPYGDYTTVYKSSVNTTANAYNDMKNSGYNNWELSNVRQWLNSSAGANAWFTPSHVGDVAPDYSSQAGFLSGFSAEFQSVLTPTRSGVSANTVTDGGTTYYTYDKMFLPSGYEVHTNTSLTDEGPVFALYANAQDAGRIKHRLDDQSSAASWWSRSAYLSGASFEYFVTTAGRSGNFAANNALRRVAPACRIC